MSDGDEKPNTRERLKALAPGFGDRVKKAIETFPTIQVAAASIGLGYGQVKRIIDEDTVPSFPAMALLAKKSGYRFEWLAFAEGPEKGTDAHAGVYTPEGALEFLWVPEMEGRAAAGKGIVNPNELPDVKAAWPIPRALIQGMGLRPERLRIVEADGPSMEPDIRHGDLMLIHTGEQELRDGHIYVLSVADDTIVKQVQLDPTGSLHLISRNPAFAPRTVSKREREQLNFAGRVVLAMKKFV